MIVLVDAVHADQQMDQFTIARVAGRLRGPDPVNQTDVAGDTESCVNGWRLLTRGRRFIPSFTGDIDLSQLFNTSGFMLEEKVVSATPRFHLWQKT